MKRILLLLLATGFSSLACETEVKLPKPDFEFVVEGLKVTFTNKSTGATNYVWVFGDGKNSYDKDPVHNYEKAGVYTVTMEARDGSVSQKASRGLFVNDVTKEPKASFTFTVTGLSVAFINQSTNATSYVWSFGDDETSTLENVTHTYATSGTYSVALKAINSVTSNQSVQRVVVAFITQIEVPEARFTFTATAFTVTFNNESVNATSYVWEFGDGSRSIEASPTYTYTIAGTYSVKLTAINDVGIHSLSKNVTVNTATSVQRPDANFAFTISGLSVTFKDLSTNNPTTWYWRFGDNKTSTEQNPIHTYSIAGTYQVVFYSGNSAGNSLDVEKFVTIAPPPVANFTFVVTGLSVTFTSTSTNNPTSYSWTFGDGGTSTSANPAHTYSAGNTYTVTLTATNAAGSNSISKNVTVGLANNPPTAPTYTAPANAATGISYNQITFTRGTSTDADGDPITYTLYVKETAAAAGTFIVNGTPMPATTLSLPEPGAATPVPARSYKSGTSYTWYVVASDGKATTKGNEWTFTTKNAVQQGTGGHYYEFRYNYITNGSTWTNAATDAVARGGYLVEIANSAEQTFLQTEIANSDVPKDRTVNDGGGSAYVWMGATDQATEGTWVWNGNNDATTTSVSSYTNWGQGAPEPDDYKGPGSSGTGQDYGAICVSANGWPSFNPNYYGRQYQWNDIEGTNSLPYIVEYDSAP